LLNTATLTINQLQTADWVFTLKYDDTVLKSFDKSSFRNDKNKELIFFENIMYTLDLTSSGTESSHPLHFSSQGYSGLPYDITNLIIQINDDEYNKMNALSPTVHSLEFKLNSNIYKGEFYTICRQEGHKRMVQKGVVLPNPYDTLCNIQYRNIVGYGTDNIEKRCSDFYAGDNLGNLANHFEYEDSRRMCRYLYEVVNPNNPNICRTNKCEYDDKKCYST
tara:strand:- start:2454 stop:3116 length:663 start_codon:yes stop_codon:yes gene_type:complete